MAENSTGLELAGALGTAFDAAGVGGGRLGCNGRSLRRTLLRYADSDALVHTTENYRGPVFIEGEAGAVRRRALYETAHDGLGARGLAPAAARIGCGTLTTTC